MLKVILVIDIKPIRPDIIEKTDAFPLLSEFSHKLLEDKKMKMPLNNTKLVAHHCGVKNYLIILPLLQFLITQGVEISKVHKAIKFKQGFFLKNFIDENIRMRAAATNPFIKNALKSINNAIYGRTLLSPLNYATEAKICHDENNSGMLKSFSKPTFRKVDKINNDRFLVTYNRSSVLASSPIYVGLSILDHAKLYMLLLYKFWYSTILPTYGKKAQFVYCDTDSFVINLFANDIVDEIKGPFSSHLDLSNFPKTIPCIQTCARVSLGS